MRHNVFASMILLVILPVMAMAADFLGAPVMPGGTVTVQTESKFEKTYDLNFEAVVNFYNEAFKDEKDIKFWDRRDEKYIEDHGSRLWHSVSITKLGNGGTGVSILKDNWTWIIGTLILRFFAVFAVLMMLYIALAISGAIVSRSVRKAETEE